MMRILICMMAAVAITILVVSGCGEVKERCHETGSQVTKFATFGKKRKRTFSVNGNVAANKIHNVKPSEVDRKPATKFEDKADLSGLAIALVLLVASISLLFIM